MMCLLEPIDPRKNLEDVTMTTSLYNVRMHPSINSFIANAEKQFEIEVN